MEHPSNIERAKRRQICREKLSEYLSKNHVILLPESTDIQEQSLDIEVPADQVRLQPKPNDPYRWKVDKTATHLFSKGLSKVSVGIYDQLIDGVGCSFTASLAATLESTRSYTELEQENTKLHEQIKYWQDSSAAEAKFRIAAEEEIQDLKKRVAIQTKQQRAFESFLSTTGKAVRDQIMLVRHGVGVKSS